ncbi:hypothetical protein HMPREF0762_01095 [Slackia exigua ATCC 700122]|uniref:Uncharacterized protein n=1 Tax=Slackia exigua (strain ATCC 700122 / DSM 15923 / CIP 105133 / JCM 11022 / KCTC 5966 / S-7) TaxID=649764 RepID=D0WH64_SLAES|nr:hypothetical protein HMPREF0762_01095 [Slackia exigua ATCC 700122]
MIEVIVPVLSFFVSHRIRRDAPHGLSRRIRPCPMVMARGP